MNWVVVPITSILQILLSLYVATIDVATRVISNEICLALALLNLPCPRKLPNR
jgi:prepilin peptidase CpaA